MTQDGRTVDICSHVLWHDQMSTGIVQEHAPLDEGTSGAGEQAHNKKWIVVKHVLNKTNRTADTEKHILGKGWNSDILLCL